MTEKEAEAAQKNSEDKASESADTRRPYQKPSLEIHSDSNLWAFGTLGG